MAKIYITIISIFAWACLATSTSAAGLSLSPASVDVKAGDVVTMRVVVSTDVPINAVSGSVNIPSFFSVDSLSKTGSILNFWVTEPNFSASSRTVQFEGVALGGFAGDSGTVLVMKLRALKDSSGEIAIVSGQILANDGQGTNITKELVGSEVVIEPKSATPAKPVPAKTGTTTPTKSTASQDAKNSSQTSQDSETDSSTGTAGDTEAPGSLPAEEVQRVPTLESPEIVAAQKFGEAAISGTSQYASAQVLLTFISENGIKIFITGATDESGSFTLLVPQTLKRGVYRVSAVVIENTTSYSHTSSEIIITVGNIFSDLGIEVRVALGLLVLTLGYFIVRSYFFLKKNKKINFFVKKETEEAEQALHQSFRKLEQRIEDTFDERMTNTEREKEKIIKKELNRAEEIIEKEIKDIKKL